MILQYGDETLAVGGLDQMNHFVDNHVFKEVSGFLDEFRVQADVSSPVVTASPFGFHPLQKVTGNLHFQFWLPFSYEGGYHFVKDGLVPLVGYFSSFGSIAAWANDQSNAFVVDRNARPDIEVSDCHQMPSPPKVMAFPFYESPRSLPHLFIQLLLLISNPTELGNRICTGHFETCRFRSNQRDVPFRRMYRKMDILDVLLGHPNQNLSEFYCLAHQ